MLQCFSWCLVYSYNIYSFPWCNFNIVWIVSLLDLIRLNISLFSINLKSNRFNENRTTSLFNVNMKISLCLLIVTGLNSSPFYLIQTVIVFLNCPHVVLISVPYIYVTWYYLFIIMMIFFVSFYHCNACHQNFYKTQVSIYFIYKVFLGLNHARHLYFLYFLFLNCISFRFYSWIVYVTLLKSQRMKS